MEEKLLYLASCILQIQLERDAMIAENREREHRQESQAWSGEEFRKLADRIDFIKLEIKKGGNEINDNLKTHR